MLALSLPWFVTDMFLPPSLPFLLPPPPPPYIQPLSSPDSVYLSLYCKRCYLVLSGQIRSSHLSMQSGCWLRPSKVKKLVSSGSPATHTTVCLGGGETETSPPPLPITLREWEGEHTGTSHTLEDGRDQENPHWQTWPVSPVLIMLAHGHNSYRPVDNGQVCLRTKALDYWTMLSTARWHYHWSITHGLPSYNTR